MDSEEEMDDDLRRAIEASLRSSPESASDPGSKEKQPVVDLTGDSDDEVVQIFPKSNSVVGSETDADEDSDDELLRRAIEMSKQDYAANQQDVPEAPKVSEKEDSKNPDVETPSKKSEEPPIKNNSAPKPTGIFGLDRKQMEQERLARIAKRKAEDPAPVEQPETKMLKTDSSKDTLSIANAAAISSSSTSSRASIPDIRKARNEQTTMPSKIPSVQFPAGVVKKTWAFSKDRLGEDIKIEEVLQSWDLELAVLSSFMWDIEWLFSKMRIPATRLLLIMQAKEESTKRQYESETAAMGNLRLCFPPMDGQVNCMHSKLMLLFHPHYVRIVVPTANLTPYDWGEQGGVMENSAFLIDLPKKTNQAANESSKTAFYEDLVYFLKASTLHENIIAKLDDFDFSKTAHIAFVHTIGGSHTGDSWKRTGYCGLGRAVDSLGLRISKPINIDYVTSSVGSLNDEFMRTIYLAAQGDDGLTELNLRSTKRTNTSQHQKAIADEWQDRFRVYFPSSLTVDNTKGKRNCAGTICFQSKWYEGAKFPRHVLRDCESRREGLLMHNKILYSRPDEPIPMRDDFQCRGWAYIGSANLSESAWGRLVQDRTTKEPKLNCRNWECGVLMPVIDKRQGTSSSSLSITRPVSSSAESTDMLSIFQGTVPVPMRVPGKLFGADRKPWYNTFA